MKKILATLIASVFLIFAVAAMASSVGSADERATLSKSTMSAASGTVGRATLSRSVKVQGQFPATVKSLSLRLQRQQALHDALQPKKVMEAREVRRNDESLHLQNQLKVKAGLDTPTDNPSVHPVTSQPEVTY